jgi:hypothetical protein
VEASVLCEKHRQEVGAGWGCNVLLEVRPQVRVVDSLVDDAGTATPPPAAVERRTTPPPAANSRMGSPLRTSDAGAGGVVGDVGMPASPRIIDVDPISARPAGDDDDLVKDQAQIGQAPGGPGTSGVQVPNSSPTSPRLPRREID